MLTHEWVIIAFHRWLRLSVMSMIHSALYFVSWGKFKFIYIFILHQGAPMVTILFDYLWDSKWTRIKRNDWLCVKWQASIEMLKTVPAVQKCANASKRLHSLAYLFFLSHSFHYHYAIDIHISRIKFPSLCLAKVYKICTAKCIQSLDNNSMRNSYAQ